MLLVLIGWLVGWLVVWKAIWELSRSCLPSVAGGHRPEAREVPGFGVGGKRKERKEGGKRRQEQNRVYLYSCCECFCGVSVVFQWLQCSTMANEASQAKDTTRPRTQRCMFPQAQHNCSMALVLQLPSIWRSSIVAQTSRHKGGSTTSSHIRWCCLLYRLQQKVV